MDGDAISADRALLTCAELARGVIAAGAAPAGAAPAGATPAGAAPVGAAPAGVMVMEVVFFALRSGRTGSLPSSVTGRC